MRQSSTLRYHNNQEIIILTSSLLLLLYFFFGINLSIFSWQLIPSWYLFKVIASGIILFLTIPLFIYIFIAIIVRISDHFNKKQKLLAKLRDILISIIILLAWCFASFLFITQSLGTFLLEDSTLNNQFHYPAYAKTIYIYESPNFLEKDKTYSLWIQNGWLPLMYKQTNFTSWQPVKNFDETCLQTQICSEEIIQLPIDNEFFWNLNLKTGKHWYLSQKTGKKSQYIRLLRNNYEL